MAPDLVSDLMLCSLRLRRLLLLTATSVALLLPFGCDVGGGSTNDVSVSGRVLDAASNPVDGAQVVLRFTDDTDEQVERSTTTDSTGRFARTIDVEGPTEVTITVQKQGVSAQQTRQVSPDVGGASDLTFTLGIGGEENREPGRPTDILLQDQSTNAIRVQESGGTSTARLTFQVVDSTGKAIEADQAVDVDFRFGTQPGDASLTPSTVQTNGQGQATVNVSSGTTAGVVQLVAETERPDGTTFQSKPVSLSIHGGLPNKCHFSLAPDQFNFPGLVELGVSNSIQVFVGDKFGNPVVPGTSVSFSTNAGLIGGSVALTSAEPLPQGGVGTVRAETAGTDDVNTIVDPDNCPDPASTGNENTISETIPVVFSGRPEVEVVPDSAELGQTYELTVWDAENNNPLAPGTSIQVQAEGTKVKAVGNTDITVDDTDISDNDNDGFDAGDIVNEEETTAFTFRVVEDQEVDEEGTPTIETVTISVSGPNGSLEVVLTPTSPSGSATTTSQSLTPTRGASVHQTSDGVVIRAPKK